MFTERVEVMRPVEGSPDTTLTHQAWEFILMDNLLVLDRWAVWTRPTRRHQFKPQGNRMYQRGGGRRISDTGTIFLGPFDVHLPEDVKAEAKTKLLDHIIVCVERPR